MEGRFDHDDLSAALDRIAAWLLAAYGARLKRISLSLEGYYGPISECYGIVPITLDRGTAPDGSQETRETLPGSEICDHAETLLARLMPCIRCTRDSGRDVREVASSELLNAGDVSAHRRIELLNAYGRLSTPSRSARQ